MLGKNQLKSRFGPLCAILLVFGCLTLAGCGEEEAPDAPPSDEQFDDTSGGGSA